MANKQPEDEYPIKSLHEFRAELDREWGKFKFASVISILLGCAILIFAASRIIRTAALGFEPEYIVVILFATALVVYGMWIMGAQVRFLRKWERRMRALVDLEERLLNDKLENTSS